MVSETRIAFEILFFVFFFASWLYFAFILWFLASSLLGSLHLIASLYKMYFHNFILFNCINSNRC